MKIAVVHNDYGKFSGEEAVVRDHIALLQAAGETVAVYRRSSAELRGGAGAVKGFLSGLYNPFSRRDFARFLDREQPEIVHIHNLYPLITPGILPEAKKRKIKVVMTIHNFRLFCPNGLFMVNGAACEKCAIERSVLPCLRHNCLGSGFKTLGYALRCRIAQLTGYYRLGVDRYFCLTPFQRDKLISYGVEPGRCRIVPNFISGGWLDKVAQAAADRPGKYIAYMGRISEEKGIDLLLDAAAALPGIPFKIAGNGAEHYIDRAPSNVEFVGFIKEDRQLDFLQQAKIQVMTSRCYENFPTTLLQGMSLGIPSVVPDWGGMPGIVGDGGRLFIPGNAMSLAEQLKKIWDDQNEAARLGECAERRCREHFTPEKILTQLQAGYRQWSDITETDDTINH